MKEIVLVGKLFITILIDGQIMEIFKALWEKVLIKFNSILDLDVINLDGSHANCKRGGGESRLSN
ncbi:MAG: hypothetical protein U0354_18785 [Candidatus Sericytochromatia bacterium]